MAVNRVEIREYELGVDELDVIERIEQDLGKPVITSNQACFWASLRLMGLPDGIEGHGRLLRECLDPITQSDFYLPGTAASK